MSREGTGFLTRTAGLATSLALGATLFLAACASSGPATSPASQSTQAQQSASATVVPAAVKTPAAAAPTQSAAAKGPTASTVALDACSLLTPEEVQAALGKAVVSAKETTGDPRAVGCSYHDAARQPNRFVSTTVYALSPGEAKAIHEATKAGKDQVAGIGEDAYWDKTFNSLSVLKGRYEVGLSVTGTAADDPLKVAQTLAPKLLSRLP